MTARGGRRQDERGTITPLLVGFAIVIVLGIVLVVDATGAYLERQSLSTLADGAALQAADLGVGDLAYGGGISGERLPVDEGTARAAVTDYLRRIGAYAEHPGLEVDVRVSPTEVTVRLRAPVDLPLTMPGLTGTAPVSATAAAVTTID